MKSDKRPKVRPQPQLSIEDKVFTPVVQVPKHVPRGIAPVLGPAGVVRDLRRGSLKSLDRYLGHHQGLPDPEVASALRALISGRYPSAKFRILVVEHPEAPKNKGGRPKTDNCVPTRAELEVAEAYEALPPMKKTAAYAQIAEDLEWSVSAIRKALKKVRDHIAHTAVEAEANAREEERWLPLLERRAEALTTLRKSSGKAD